MSKPRIYISGPITVGDRDAHFEQASALHRQLLVLGFAPLNPILSLKLPWAFEMPHDLWVDSDLPWVAVSDGVFRLPGYSVGADREVAYARELETPVFTELDSLLDYFGMGDAS